MRPWPKDAAVPCGTCSLCCAGYGAVFLRLGDDPTGLRLIEGDVDPNTGKPGLRLDLKPNGECVHLEAGRCGVYDRRPATCRSFDCRRLARLPLETRLKMTRTDPHAKALIAQGREKLREAPL